MTVLDDTCSPGQASGVEPPGLVRLRRELQALRRVVVAFSGGADSALLAWVATDTLGPRRALCVTAVSPSLSPEELEDTRCLAGEWGLNWEPLVTDEMERAAYRVNGPDRCFHCKSSLLDVLEPRALAMGESNGGHATVILGVNLDDLGDHRPGQEAASGRGARFPMVDAGLDKTEVRSISRALGLRTWDKPAAACLASRVPYGTPVTAPTLSAVAIAESALRKLGFRELRVRHYGDTARVELGCDELALAVARRQDVIEAVRSGGYSYVTLDLDGFRSGNLNQALGVSPGPSLSPVGEGGGS